MPEKRRHSSKASAPSGAADSDDSPKHAKRDRKPATERHIPELDPPLDPSDNNDGGRRRRLQDPLPLEENPSGADATNVYKRDLANGNTTSVQVNPTYVPRSSYYFQHDDRGGTSFGRSNRRRIPADDRWAESRPRFRGNDKLQETNPAHDRKSSRQDLELIPPSKENDAWTHDKFVEAVAEEPEAKRMQPSLERKRDSGRREFREKPPVRPENKERSDDHEKRIERKYPDMNLAQRERERYHQRGDDIERGRWMDSGQLGRHQQRRAYGSYLGDGNQQGGRFDSTRRNNGSTVTVTDRWAHDRFEELNRSPTPKHEEDSIAQIEALLAA